MQLFSHGADVVVVVVARQHITFAILLLLLLRHYKLARLIITHITCVLHGNCCGNSEVRACVCVAHAAVCAVCNSCEILCVGAFAQFERCCVVL